MKYHCLYSIVRLAVESCLAAKLDKTTLSKPWSLLLDQSRSSMNFSGRLSSYLFPLLTPYSTSCTTEPSVHRIAADTPDKKVWWTNWTIFSTDTFLPMWVTAFKNFLRFYSKRASYTFCQKRPLIYGPFCSKEGNRVFWLTLPCFSNSQGYGCAWLIGSFMALR